MSRTFECPKCGQDISDSYESDDPSVGLVGGWYCDACNEGFGDEDGYEPHETDVQIFGTCGGPAPDYPETRCAAHPDVIPEMGYGLAGGGIGAYSYCPICGHIINKTQDHD